MTKLKYLIMIAIICLLIEIHSQRSVNHCFSNLTRTVVLWLMQLLCGQCDMIRVLLVLDDTYNALFYLCQTQTYILPSILLAYHVS